MEIREDDPSFAAAFAETLSPWKSADLGCISIRKATKFDLAEETGASSTHHAL